MLGERIKLNFEGEIIEGTISEEYYDQNHYLGIRIVKDNDGNEYYCTIPKREVKAILGDIS